MNMRRSFQFMTIRYIANLSRRSFSSCEAQINFHQNITNFINTVGSDNQLIRNARRYLCATHIPACWSCNEKSERENEFFCGKCGSLQDAPEEYDYFKLLSIENKFTINMNQLTKKFRRLQTLIHPDKFSNRNEHEQKNSLQWSSLINKAFKTLSTPIKRGEYLLSQQGISLPEDNSALDKEFLLEMMERNEEIEDSDKDNIIELREKVKKNMKDKIFELNDSFSKGDFEQAKSILVEMKYFNSLDKAIKEKAVKLDVIK